MAWKASHRAASRAATERRIEGWLALLASYLDADPTLRTEDLAERIGYDRSTIRRWRAILRESQGKAKKDS